MQREKRRAGADTEPEICLDLKFKRRKRHRSRRRDPEKLRRMQMLRLFVLLCALSICAGTAAFWLYSGEKRSGQSGNSSRLAENEQNNTQTTVRDTAQTLVQIESAEEEKRTVRLLFGGDVYLSSYVLEAYDQAGGINGLLDETYRAEIEAADLFIVNQEFPFSERGTPAADKSFTFRLPPERAGILKELGIDLCVLANNHVLDYGREALSDTLQTLDERGIKHIGAGNDLKEARQAYIAEIGGQKFGFLAASRVAPDTGWSAGAERPGVLLAYDPSALLQEVRELRTKCDHLIVYMHWGVEREETPRAEIRALAHSIADAGADLIVGAHPHVLQGAELYQGTPIIYSLGNFLFGSSIPRTMLLRAEFQPGTRAPKLSLLPGTGSMGRTVSFSKNAQAAFYAYYEDISSEISVNQDGSLVTVSEKEVLP